MVDKRERVRKYIEQAENYQYNFKELYNRGEYPKACESLWGAIVSLLNALSIIRNQKPLTSHQEIKNFVKEIAVDCEDEELYKLFKHSEKLHANFYHQFFDQDDYLVYIDDGIKLIENLKRVIWDYIKRK
jgi:HEPN domain-containing protein